MTVAALILWQALAEDLAAGALPSGLRRPFGMGDLGRRIEIVIEAAFLVEGVLGGGVVLELETLVLPHMLLQPLVHIGIRPADIGDVESARFVRLIESIGSRRLLIYLLMQRRFVKRKWSLEAGFCHADAFLSFQHSAAVGIESTQPPCALCLFTCSSSRSLLRSYAAEPLPRRAWRPSART